MRTRHSSSGSELCYLEEQHEILRNEALAILEALSNARCYALLQLQKTQIVFRYLNWKQQEYIENHSNGIFSLQKINSLFAFPLGFAEDTAVPAAAGFKASYLRRVQTARKNMVQFGIIKARAEELIGVIAKSAAVFNHQYKTAYKELFPLGFFSRLRRSVLRFFDHPYFSWQELNCLASLGAAAGFVFKMAEIPVLGVRR